jgi:fucose 4-O-acetylase-like acetyltransferase
VRGIGIGFVILGHMAFPPTVMCLIYAFHVPLFFIVTGYLFSSSKSAGEMIWAKAKGLLVPYYAFSALMFLLLLCFSGDQVPVCLDGRTCREALWPTVLGTLPVIETTWFLPCLFATSIVAIPLSRLAGWKRQVFVMAACVMMAQLGTSYQWPGMPYRLNSVPMGVSFLLIGMLIRRQSKWENERGCKFVFAAGLCAVLFIPLALWHGRVDMNSNRLGCAAVFLMTGTLGTVMVFSTCRFLEVSKSVVLMPLAYLGRRSLLILVTHEVVAAVVHAYFGEWGLSHYRLDRVASMVILLVAVEGLHGVSGLSRRILVLVQTRTPRVLSLMNRS